VTYTILTLGCKLNQADSAVVAGRLGGHARAVALEDADLVVLNTCTVTHKAEREARRLLRTIRRSNPRALVAVMGCAAKRDAELFRAMPEVDEVLASGQSLDSFLHTHGAEPASRDHGCVPYFGDRTRAFLKIQEGCDFPCTYCIVPSVRGASRSVPPGQVIEDLQHLIEMGHREVVLTGINTGEYGRDLGFRGGLPALLEQLLVVPGAFRIRLNSVEPRAVTPALRTLMRSEARLCPHLQIPLQSGSDAVLADMKRNYRAGFYADLLKAVAEEIPGVALGADVLAGFPTETAAHFEVTLALVEALPLAFVHAFSYSPRPGTAAAQLSPLSAREVARRTAELRALGARKSRAFAASFAGAAREALTLMPEPSAGRALTDNYLDVAMEERLPANRLVHLELSMGEDGALRGRVASPEA
jgi:threonylcarbamoyladenosine tRNA methylthiotransferase MtaB